MELSYNNKLKLRWLSETVSTLVLDNGMEQECIKDRNQYFVVNGYQKAAYEVVSIDDIPNDIIERKKEYYAKHLWVNVEESKKEIPLTKVSGEYVRAVQIEKGFKIYCDGELSCLKMEKKLNELGIQTRAGCNMAGMWSIYIISVPEKLLGTTKEI